jgi:methyl-accepting chemotaxis protein
MQERVGPGAAAGPRIRALYGALGVVVLGYAVSLIVRPNGVTWTWLDGWCVPTFELALSLLVLARAVRYRRDRSWALFLGLGGCAWALGDFAMTIETLHGATPAVLSVANVLWAGFYPLAYVGVMLLMRRDVRGLTAANYLDGIIAGLITAAALVAFAFHGIATAAGGGNESVAVNLVYPVGDLLLLGLTMFGIVLMPRGLRLRWILLGVAGLLNAAGDISALFGGIAATHVGFVLNSGAWPESLLCISAALWLPRDSSPEPRESKASGFAVPAVASGLALVILFVGSLDHTSQVAIGLASATLLAAGVRFYLALQRMNHLTKERERETRRATAAERDYLARAAEAERESGERAAHGAAAELASQERAAAAERASLKRAALAEREARERAAEAAEAQRATQERAALAERAAEERAAAAERKSLERATAAERESLKRAAEAAEAERAAQERAAVAERQSLERTAAAEREFLEKQAAAERESREVLEAAVRSYSVFAARVADGDLTAVVEPAGDADLQALAGSLNKMVSGLGQISGEIKTGVEEIGGSTAEILASASEQNYRAVAQSAAISQTTTTINALRAAADEMSQRARDVAREANESVKVSDEGTEALGAIVTAMEEIRSRVDGIAREIAALSERTEQIGDITDTVTQLADRSNLLALNASIEAARAGEHGRGFAVVADHVRDLSEQSKAATARVATILDEIRQATAAAVRASQQGSKVVDDGLALTDRAGQGIRSLTSTIRGASHAAEEIAGSAQQQSVDMGQIAESMAELDESTRHFLDGAEQSQRAAENLDDLSAKLTAVTDRYQVAQATEPVRAGGAQARVAARRRSATGHSRRRQPNPHDPSITG